MRISALFALLNLIILIVLSSLPLTSVRAMSPSGLDPKQVKLIGSMVASAVFGLFSMAIILFKKDEAEQDFMIVVPPGGVLLEEFLHRSRAKVLVDLGVAVTQRIGHFIVEGTLEPIIHHVNRKSPFRPFQNRPGEEVPDLPV